VSDPEAQGTVNFFVAGGTVPPGAPSYIERVADRELYEGLRAGEFCYVLNSRQMGKSSLAVRTVTRLQADDIACGFVDLTRLGGSTVTVEQWYAGLLIDTGRAFGLRAEAAAYLRDQRAIGPLARYLGFLQEVVLVKLTTPAVLMIDEVDAVRSLPFPSDELFAGIRQLHNGRASDPALRRLTVCLLGAALPSDLISDMRTTPFNVGLRIGLRDFTRDEVKPLAAALGPEGPSVIVRVLRWTGGHPFLTQVLCSELALLPSPRPADVDRIVRSRYLDARARESDTNLADIGNRLLGRGDPNMTDGLRADTLTAYSQVLSGGVADDEANPALARVKMSGAARLEKGRLVSRNHIYAKVFGHDWIRENMPGQEQHRQMRAFRRGVFRASLFASIIVASLGILSGMAIHNANVAQRVRFEAQRSANDATQQKEQAILSQQIATEQFHRAEALMKKLTIAEKKAEAQAALEHKLRLAAQAAEVKAETALAKLLKHKVSH